MEIRKVNISPQMLEELSRSVFRVYSNIDPTITPAERIHCRGLFFPGLVLEDIMNIQNELNERTNEFRLGNKFQAVFSVDSEVSGTPGQLIFVRTTFLNDFAINNPSLPDLREK